VAPNRSDGRLLAACRADIEHLQPEALVSSVRTRTGARDFRTDIHDS
jgi:hypothetical protein